MNNLVGHYSENEDDPEVYESSGDEWNSASEKKRNSRRSSQRLSKKPRISHVESSDSDESEDEDTKRKTKNGINKRQKVLTAKATTKRTVVSPTAGSKIPTVDFINGGFLILKKDAQLGDPNKHPCIWRIDGKALLQKYESFEEDGKVRHRNTSIYTGWSPMDKDLYAPVTVYVIQHNGQNLVVELNWEKLKEINMDSD